jgi:hypothetical protein
MTTQHPDIGIEAIGAATTDSSGLTYSLAGEHVSVGDRKRIEADMIAGPAWTLDGRTFPAAGGATDPQRATCRLAPCFNE